MREKENRVFAPNEDAPDSVRGLTRVQYSSRVNGNGCGGCLKAWSGTGRRVKVKRALEEEQRNKSFRGCWEEG